MCTDVDLWIFLCWLAVLFFDFSFLYRFLESGVPLYCLVGIFFYLIVVATGVPGEVYFWALGTDTYSPASLVRVICGLAERF